MSVTLTNLITRVRAEWPDEFFTADLTDAIVTQYLNDVQRRICRSKDFTWMEMTVTRSTVDNQRQYSVPAAAGSSWADVNSGTVRLWKNPINLELINSDSRRVVLAKMLKPTLEILRQFKDTTKKSTPQSWCERAGFIELFNLPDHGANSNVAWTMNLEYHGYLADLSAGSDNNYLTNTYPDVLVYGAVAKGYAFAHDNEMEGNWNSKAIGIFNEMSVDNDMRKLGDLDQGLMPGAGQSLGGPHDDFDNDDGLGPYGYD